MQATIEKVSNLERRLNVSLPVQDIDAEVQSRLKKIARNVRMHGFRPGKVPFRLVQAQYGGQVRQEVLGDALQKTFGEAVRQQNLRVAGMPRFEPKTSEEIGDQFRVQRYVRSVSGHRARRSCHGDGGAACRGGRRRRNRQDAGDPAQTARAIRCRRARCPARRSHHDRLSRHAKRRRVRRRQRQRPYHRAGRRAFARRFREPGSRSTYRRKSDI